MNTPLKYTVIKSEKQYQDYCSRLEGLHQKEQGSKEEEIELLSLLIEKWEEGHSSFKDLDPVELLAELMREHGLKAKDLGDILNLSKGTVSKILNYKKGMSKQTIRKLANYFKVSQEGFNRPYRLKGGSFQINQPL